jgi:hypothetical protein
MPFMPLEANFHAAYSITRALISVSELISIFLDFFVGFPLFSLLEMLSHFQVDANLGKKTLETKKVFCVFMLFNTERLVVFSLVK